jgi:pimeloyl-ACP methyl ester carboxylesterase/photosystem II stability/assembly factor-like uncharacterized protein
VFKSTNGGGDWSAANTRLPNPYVDALAIDPATPATLYAGTSGGGVFKSTNGGGDWSEANTGLTNPYVEALAIDPVTPASLYAGTDHGGVFKSTNGGGDWSAANTGLTNPYVYALAIDPVTPATLYAGTDQGVFKSTDGGGNWSAANTGLTNPYVYALAIDPVTPATLYAGTWPGGVFKSTNGGGNWSAVNTGLTNTYIHTLAIDPAMPATLYAGTWYGGVFKSTNGGGDWSAFNTGLSATIIDDLVIDPTTPTILYAGTWGGGVFAIQQTATGSYSISGRVTDAGGNPIPNVTITADAGHNTLTDSNGNYVLSNLPTGSYTVTPSSDALFFIPPSREVTISNGDITDQDFIGKRIPIVFIPGVMGSSLFNTDPVLGEIIVWPNLIILEPHGVTTIDCLNGNIVFPPIYNLLMVLKLQSDGSTPFCNDMAFTSVHTKEGKEGLVTTVAGTDFYETIFNHFTNPRPGGQGYQENIDFWVFPYDWRLDLRTSANQLDGLVGSILQQTQAPKVNIVAHSMGGLVTRQYLSDDVRADKLNKVVILGTPFLGTPDSFFVLLDGGCVKEIMGYCLPRKQVIKALVPDFPAFTQLLPSETYFTVKGGGFYGDENQDNVRETCPDCLSFDQTYSSEYATNLNPTLFADANEFHTGLDHLTDWNGVSVTIIAGNNQQTLVGLYRETVYSWDGVIDVHRTMPVYSLEGDGTASLLSVSLSNADNGQNLRGSANYIERSNISHGDLVKDPGTLAIIDQELGLPPLPGAEIQVQKPMTEASGSQIVAYGVQAMHVVDAAGNHTGPSDSEGLIEQAIPGSAYNSDQDTATVALQGGQTYTITIVPTGTSPVEIRLVRETGTQPINNLLYIGLDVTGQSRIRMIGDPNTEDNWQLDVYGDGSNVLPVPPSSEYQGQPTDTTPPTVSIQLDGTLGPNGWYISPVTVTLSAEDNQGGSGVAQIEYGFGNLHQGHVYTGPFVVSPDDVTSLYVIAIDLSGNMQTIPAKARIGPEKIYLPTVSRLGQKQ